MSWRTRHIRKRNKGKDKRRATKRSSQCGGASVEKLKDIIAHLIETKEEVTATIDKLPATIKFDSSSKFTGVSGINGIFSFKVDKSSVFGGKITITKNAVSQKNNVSEKELILDKLNEFEKTVKLKKENEKIKNESDAKIQANASKQATEAAVAANKMAVEAEKQAKAMEDAKNATEASIKMIKDSYKVTVIDLKDVMQKEEIKSSMLESFQTQPYTESALKHLQFCVEKYLIKPITVDKIKTFLGHFKEST